MLTQTLVGCVRDELGIEWWVWGKWLLQAKNKNVNHS